LLFLNSSLFAGKVQRVMCRAWKGGGWWRVEVGGWTDQQAAVT
jgi:hypothetical protein